MIQLVIDEARDKRFRLYNGKREDWHDYWLHWSHIYRKVEEDPKLGTPIYTWLRSDRDDWVHATIYWRIGIDRFGGKGEVLMPEDEVEPNSYMVNPNRTVSFSPEEMFKKSVVAVDSEDDDDWR